MRHENFELPRNPRSAARRAYASEAEERIRAFMPMVKKLAWHAHGSGRPGIEIEDLLQVGLIAISDCVRRHDGQGEHAFAAYAKTRVRGAMFDLIRREAPTTRTAARKRREIEEESRRLALLLGRVPSESELAQALGMEAHQLTSVRAQSEPLRFDSIESCYSDSNVAFADGAADGHRAMEDAQQVEHLATAIANLPERLQMITQLYFVEELNLGEIAAILRVSIPRVHQLKAQALERLRADMAG